MSAEAGVATTPEESDWRMGGRGGKQRLIPDPVTGELHPYQRVSSFARTIDDTFGLSMWKTWQAVKGAAADPDLRRQALHAERTPGGVIQRLIDAGGTEKRDRGRDRHVILANALVGAPVPDMPAASRAELDRILRLVEGLGTVVAVETPVVCDEWRLSGTVDLVLDGPWQPNDARTRGNGPVIVDFKTGADYRLSAGIQLVCYARSRYWNFDTETRGGLVAPTLPRLCVLHAPQDGAEPRILTVRPDAAKRWAQLAHDVLAARKEAKAE